MIGLVRSFFSTDRHYYRFFNRILGVLPRNIDLYKLALVHRSASVVLEDGGVVNNERLEFLGDAILQAVSSDMLFMEYPEFDEGDLTRLRSKIVGRESMNGLAKTLGLDGEIVTMPAMLLPGQQAIMGDSMEALIGALYLDKGYDVAFRVVVKLLKNNMDIKKMGVTEEDFKSRILEWGQKERRSIEFVSNVGRDDFEGDHSFETVLMVDGVSKGFGAGRNKKQSEQRAAKQFFEEIND